MTRRSPHAAAWQAVRAVASGAARLSPRRVLVLGGLSLLVLRLAISAARTGPVVMADEAGYLLNARVLAGGMTAEMGSSPFYRGGYSLFIAPVVKLDADPIAAYHGVLAVNAALAACLVPLLYLLLTRCVDVAPRTAAWAALAGAAYPSVTALSQVAMSENALFPLTVAWLLCVGLLLRDRALAAAPAWAAAAGLIAATLWIVHGRMVVAVGLTVIVLALGAIRGRRGRLAAAAGLAALAGGMLSGAVLNDWLGARNYDGRGIGELRTVLAPLHDGDGVLAVLRNVVCQSWYLLTATLGVVLLLVAWIAPRALARMRAGRGGPADGVLVLLLATTAGLVLVSSLWFASATRPDQLIYGRYTEPVVPALVAVGLAALARAGPPPRPGVLVAALLTLTGAVVILRAGFDVRGEASRWNVAGLPSVTGSLSVPVLALAGIVACVAMWLLAWVARRHPAGLAPLALVAFLPVTAYDVHLPVLRSEHDIYPPAWVSPMAAVEWRGARAVGYDLDHFDHIRVKVYQWFLPRTRVVLFHGRAERAPVDVFFSARRLSGRLAREPADSLWSDRGADQALWQRAPAHP
jgi:hypothetical protein